MKNVYVLLRKKRGCAEGCTIIDIFPYYNIEQSANINLHIRDTCGMLHGLDRHYILIVEKMKLAYYI